MTSSRLFSATCRLHSSISHPLPPQHNAQHNHMTIQSSQTNLWELLEAVAIMGILRRVHRSYFSSIQITVLNGVLGSENMINQL